MPLLYFTLFLSTPSARRATVPTRFPSGLWIDFYPRPPRGGRQHHLHSRPSSAPISIHALREEGDRSILKLWKIWSISIHALCEEGDVLSLTVASMAILFLSTPSARRATLSFFPASFALHNFYPRPPRGGRLPDGNVTDYLLSISIHALREEGDGHGLVTAIRDVAISIHALSEEGDDTSTNPLAGSF